MSLLTEFGISFASCFYKDAAPLELWTGGGQIAWFDCASDSVGLSVVADIRLAASFVMMQSPWRPSPASLCTNRRASS